MYEYVITDGEGVMLAHGITKLCWLDGWLDNLEDGKSCIICRAADDAKSERFH